MKNKEVAKIATKWADTTRDDLIKLIETFRAQFVGAMALQQLDMRQRGLAEQRSVLPEDAKFIHADPVNTILVVEETPQMRTVLYNSNQDYNSHRCKYRISLPYTEFIIHWKNDRLSLVFQQLRVAFRNAPLQNVGDDLYQPELPNMGNPNDSSDKLYMCLGQQRTGDYAWNNHQSMAEQTKRIISHFWGSQFTSYNERTSLFKRSLAEWAKKSAADPAFALKVNWQRFGPLNQLVAKLVGGSHTDNTVIQADLNRLYQKAWGNVVVKGEGLQRDMDAVVNLAVQAALQQQIEDLQKEISTIKAKTQRKAAEDALARAVRERNKRAAEEAIRRTCF